MALTSRWAAAQDALLAALQARPALASLVAARALTLGYPALGAQAEAMWISGAVTEWVQGAGSTGTSTTAQREETFTLAVNVLVAKTGADYKTPRDRALTLAAELEAVLRADWTLGGALFEAFVAGGEVQEGVADTQRQVLVTIEVRCRAWLA